VSGRRVEGLADGVCAGVAGNCEVRVGGRLRGVPYEQAGCGRECRAGDERQHGGYGVVYGVKSIRVGLTSRAVKSHRD
jgi:hypothetical protein